MNITKAKQALATVNQSTRNLDEADLDYINALYAKFKRRFKGCSITVEIHGGAVPNSYGYGAQATWAARTKAGFYVSRDRALTAPRAQTWGVRVTVGGDPERKTFKGWTCRALRGDLVYYR